MIHPITYEQQQLMCIYNTGTRLGLIRTLNEMRTYLEDDEQELKDLTNSTINRLNAMTDEEYFQLDLTPDFDTEDMDAI